MTNSRLYELVSSFKTAVLDARNNQYFCTDVLFHRFPHGCCGDTCCLLAEYLHSNGIETVYVCGSERDQSHAWLVVKDNRVKPPTPRACEALTQVIDILNSYSNSAYTNPVVTTRYEESDLSNGTIIDITADQFRESGIYIGDMDAFHRRFTFLFARERIELNEPRLCKLYQIIMDHLP